MSHWRALLQRNCRNVWVWLGSEQNSKGARDFLTNNFAEIRMLNTDYNLMIRHVDGAETELPLPYIEARYHFDPKDKDYRKRARISVRNFSEEEVCKVMEKLVLQHPGNPNSTLEFEMPEKLSEEERAAIMARITKTSVEDQPSVLEEEKLKREL